MTPELPIEVTTVTSVEPAPCAGDVAAIWFEELTVYDANVPPNSTAVTELKPDPPMIRSAPEPLP